MDKKNDINIITLWSGALVKLAKTIFTNYMIFLSIFLQNSHISVLQSMNKTSISPNVYVNKINAVM